MDGSDTATFTETMCPPLNLSGNGGTQSLGNGSAVGSDRGVSDPLKCHVITHPTLPSIDEVDSPEKIDNPITNPGKISPKVVEQIQDSVVIEPVAADVSGATCKVGVEAELQERIRKLREEDAEFERVDKLRQEAAELELRKKLREEAVVPDGVTSMAERVTRAVVKVPQPPPLPPTDFEKDNVVTKRKTRSEIIAEVTTKEAQEGKKKPKKTKRSHRITLLG